MNKQSRHTLTGIAVLSLFAVAYAGILKWTPHDFAEDSQEALWALPNYLGKWWWVISAFFAGLASVTILLYMVMNQAFSSLLVSRVILMGAMMCFALVPINSGWIPWGVMIASIGGFYASFLIATNWCEREDKWSMVWRALRLRKRDDIHHPSD